MPARRVIGLPLFVALVAGGGCAGLPGTTTKLSTGSSSALQISPAISGPLVVWTDFNCLKQIKQGSHILGCDGPANFDAVLKDLRTSDPPVNITNTPDANEFLVAVDGPTIVWTFNEWRVTTGDLVAYDTNNDCTDPTIACQHTFAAASSRESFEQPAVAGRYIAFQRVGAHVTFDYYDNLFGIAGPTPQLPGGAIAAFPRISRDLIVYQDAGVGNSDIFGYRIGVSTTPFRIAGGAAEQASPDVDGDYVVWVERGSSGTGQILVWNAALGATKQLTTTVSRKESPRVSQGRVVWADDRNGDFDLYSYDLVKDREDAAVVAPSDQTLPDIDGSRIVYTSDERGVDEIYLFTVTGSPPLPPPSGCDPTTTDAVGTPVLLSRTTSPPAGASGSFATAPGKTYFVCIDNGLSNGTQRTAHFRFEADGTPLLTSHDFRVNKGTPAPQVWAQFPSAPSHAWSASLFGTPPPTTVTITVRVGK